MYEHKFGAQYLLFSASFTSFTTPSLGVTDINSISHARVKINGENLGLTIPLNILCGVYSRLVQLLFGGNIKFLLGFGIEIVFRSGYQ
jgi:hypothetical protein